MQPFSFIFFVGYSLGGGGGGGVSGRVRALNLTVPLGSGRVGSDNLGYGPGSGFSFEPVQTSTVEAIWVKWTNCHVQETSLRWFELCDMVHYTAGSSNQKMGSL